MSCTGEPYPESKAEETWVFNGKLCSIVKIEDSYPGPFHYCGYARFTERPLIEQGYRGIVRYVPVHGGVTYAEKDEGGFVYGFDCNHLDDEKKPHMKDPDWVRSETEKMVRSIELAVDYEEDFLLARCDEEKAKVVDEWHEELQGEGIEFRLRDNFGAMISLICGTV